MFTFCTELLYDHRHSNVIILLDSVSVPLATLDPAHIQFPIRITSSFQEFWYFFSPCDTVVGFTTLDHSRSDQAQNYSMWASILALLFNIPHSAGFHNSRPSIYLSSASSSCIPSNTRLLSLPNLAPGVHCDLRPSTYPALKHEVFDIIGILAFCLTANTHLRHTERIILSTDISHRLLTAAYPICLTCRREAPNHSSLSSFCHNIRGVPCFPKVLCLAQISPCHISSLDTRILFSN